MSGFDHDKAWASTVEGLAVINVIMCQLHDRKPNKSAPQAEHDAWEAEMQPVRDWAIQIHYRRIQLNLMRLTK